MSAKLRLVDEPSVEEELRALLRALDKAKADQAALERKARERGRDYLRSSRPLETEFMLPTIERLRRELL